eukprot:3278156-Pyramimonas_sp.AAC.1
MRLNLSPSWASDARFNSDNLCAQRAVGCTAPRVFGGDQSRARPVPRTRTPVPPPARPHCHRPSHQWCRRRCH